MSPVPNSQLLARLEAIMAALSKTDREIFLAARLDGMDYTQIARRTNRSVKDIERRLSKAIGVITRMLEEDDGL